MRASTEPQILGELLGGVEREIERAVELRHRLHEHPELAHAEHETRALLAVEVPVAHEAVAGTGLIARVGDGDGRPVGVRAELDGLPLVERTGAAFASSGATMHACGHDVHMASLVALLRAADRLQARLPAPLAAIFQPSEEAYPSGAEQLALEVLPRLDPIAIVAAHIHPELTWGAVGLDTGPVNASCDAIELEFEGAPSHGAYPHLGSDPILALSQAVVSLHAVVGRRIDPLAAATLTIGVLEAGSAENVIPAHATGRGALRALAAQDRETLRQLAAQVVEGVARAHGCRGELRLTPGEPALENDGAIVAAGRAMLAAAGLVAGPEWRSCGSDDFAFFGERAPIAMAFVGLGGAPGFEVRPLHHPELLVPDEAVGVVARTLAVLYVAAAQAHGAAVGEDVVGDHT